MQLNRKLQLYLVKVQAFFALDKLISSLATITVSSQTRVTGPYTAKFVVDSKRREDLDMTW
ncbi:hypothetical protein PanWU01x14_242050 [Parasponia andersonii]|uniref:Uncharacterized protein n=1 Tax=Parasponia andersonii TaxID=3476 RepID=A0A2P5BGA7_PARAD|nr:hypothetical protein PanWU01x14_242050 [Parasponia andersonii]